MRSHILKITTTTSARLLLHDLVSSTTLARENQRHNFLFENTRESQQKKKDRDLDKLQSRSLFSSFLFFSSLLCPPPPLLSPAAVQCSSSRPRSSLIFSSFLCPPPPFFSHVAAQRSSSRPRSARAGNQRMAVPVPPVQGTRESTGLL